jgi:glutathione-regulated potassium-efflux system ancillary protein KefC
MLAEVLIFLAAAVICVPLAQRAKLGAVLGYLIAGALIGPFGFSLISDIESIARFSEIGVVLMLFLIGLELEPKRLMEMRQTVLGGGIFQVCLSGVVIGIGLHLLGLDWKASLIAGFALSLSSTAIAVAMMAERNLMPTKAGQSAFGISLFQDIAAIPVLAVIPLLGVAAAASSAHPSGTNGPNGLSGIWAALAAMGAIIGVIVIGRFATRPLLKLVATTNLREVFTAFSLLLVLGIAHLMSMVGLSMGLGAFLAGVLLANSEYRHALESDIEPFKGLLLGLFFISVGMAIDFGLLRSQPTMVVTLLIGFMILKPLTLWVVARFIGIHQRQRWLFAILLTQGSEFAFVLFASAQLAGILSREWSALLTMTVALSMATTPLLLLAYDWYTTRKECKASTQEPDVIDEKEARVIIAGFGRFGQIVGRLLRANGIKVIVLEHDPDQIELLRRFGNKVFYGDASRLDLLHAAGARDAVLLVNAIDDVDDSLKLTDLVRENFPKLNMIARARNVTHYIELRQRGVEIVERETFESALRLGRHALVALGVDRFRARDMAHQFRRHNIKSTEAVIAIRDDEKKIISAAQAGRDELEAQFARDHERFESEHSSKGWH